MQSGEQRGEQVGNRLQKRNNSVSPFKFYIFFVQFFLVFFFHFKTLSLSHGILIHHQFLMLLAFIFLFVDKFYIYWELILISCLEYKVLR